MGEASLIDVIEAAYRLDSDDDGWLHDLVGAAQPALDHGNGLYAFEFDATVKRGVGIGRVALSDGAVVSPRMLSVWHARLPRTVATRVYRGPRPSIANLDHLLNCADDAEGRVAMAQMCRAAGIADQLTVRATDPAHVGMAICSPLARPADPESAQQRLWARLATHVAAGYRLRRTLAGGDPLDGADAIFDTRGKLQHADGEAKSTTARERLHEAVRTIDRARTRLRRRTVDAVEIWQGLVAGTWSLVDKFDSDGQRFIIARRNPPGLTDPRALTEREHQVIGFVGLGHSNKEIAYTLGLSASTVASHLESARRKLKLKTRMDVVRLLGDALVPTDAESS